jgi:hypothetical protein
MNQRYQFKSHGNPGTGKVNPHVNLVHSLHGLFLPEKHLDGFKFLNQLPTFPFPRFRPLPTIWINNLEHFLRTLFPLVQSTLLCNCHNFREIVGRVATQSITQGLLEAGDSKLAEIRELGAKY